MSAELELASWRRMTSELYAARWRLAAAVVTVGLAITVLFVLVYFQPQDLFINHAVDQARPARAVVVRQGGFHSREHATTGVAELLGLPGGLTTLRLAPFRTSNGPAVHVWLSAAAWTLHPVGLAP
jgi:hypothetical protein